MGFGASPNQLFTAEMVESSDDSGANVAAGVTKESPFCSSQSEQGRHVAFAPESVNNQRPVPTSYQNRENSQLARNANLPRLQTD